MTPLRLGVATGASAVVALLLLAATAPALPWRRADHGVLRLSWRARPERVEICREPSAEELERIAEHMRQRLLCEGSSASYQLRVVVDDVVIDTAVVRGGGLRHDRLIHVLRDYALAGGTHRVTITLERRERVAKAPDDDDHDDDGTSADRAVREATERRRGRQAALPSRLVLDTVLAIEPGRVALMTFSSSDRSLVLRTRPGR